jgi:hypothetical protein
MDASTLKMQKESRAWIDSFRWKGDMIRLGRLRFLASIVML